MQLLNVPKKVYDVCIVGSGAGGGTAAKILTEGGLDVAMLEAGPRLDPDRDFKEHVWPYQLPHRGVFNLFFRQGTTIPPGRIRSRSFSRPHEGQRQASASASSKPVQQKSACEGTVLPDRK